MSLASGGVLDSAGLRILSVHAQEAEQIHGAKLRLRHAAGVDDLAPHLVSVVSVHVAYQDAATCIGNSGSPCCTGQAVPGSRS